MNQEQIIPTTAIKAKKKDSKNFKPRLLILMVGSKLIVVSFLVILWQSGSFTNEQFISTLSLLVATFVSLISVMVTNIMKEEETKVSKNAPRLHIRLAYMFTIIHAVILLFTLNLKGPGIITFSQMNAMIALFEMSFGGYLGTIIFKLFKSK